MNRLVFRRSIVTVLMCAGVASALVAQKLEIKTDVDKAADFSALTTYAWLKSPPVKSDIAPDAVTNPGLSQEKIEPAIVAAVDHELARRGFRRVTDDKPQVQVVYYAALNVGMNSADLGSYYQYTTGWSVPFATGQTSSLSVYEKGSIVVDVIDAATNKAIWRASAATRINHENTHEKRVARINEAIGRMFERFPKRNAKR
jgi:Domain of unknown function (DUF4136)